MSITIQTPEAQPKNLSKEGIDKWRDEISPRLSKAALEASATTDEREKLTAIGVLPTRSTFEYIRETLSDIQEQIDMIDGWLADLHQKRVELLDKKQALHENDDDLALFRSSAISPDSIQRSHMSFDERSLVILQEIMDVDEEMEQVEAIRQHLIGRQNDEKLALEKAEEADFRHLQHEKIRA